MSDSVPRSNIRWLADRWHIGMSEDAIREDMARRTASWPADQAAIGTRYAIRCHRANRRRYGWVVGGMS